MDALPIKPDAWMDANPLDTRYDQNPKVVVQTSPIHGRGVFARVDIPAFAYIGRYEGPITHHDGTHVLWLYDEDQAHWYGVDGVNEMRFLNHADEPNAEWSDLDLYATEFIPAGAEITFDYGWDEDDDDAGDDVGEDADDDGCNDEGALTDTPNNALGDSLSDDPGGDLYDDCHYTRHDNVIDETNAHWGVWPERDDQALGTRTDQPTQDD
jgi:hypothetical protein